MKSSFLDRSMDTINFNSKNFTEPQFQNDYTNIRKKNYVADKGNSHLDRIFDQTAINPHFAGMDKQLKLSSRPSSSFDIEKEMQMQRSVSSEKRPNVRNRQQETTSIQQNRKEIKQMSCEYCDSYRKKNMKYESMIYNLQKESAEKSAEIKKHEKEIKSRDTSGFEIRREYDKLSTQLKQKNMECEVLEKKISSIQLEKQEKNKELVEKEIQTANEKYFKMVDHYESTIGVLRKEIIELTEEKNKEYEKTEQIKEKENKGINTDNPMYEKLVKILCSKLHKKEDEIKVKLENYKLPEKLSVEELNKILDLYK